MYRERERERDNVMDKLLYFFFSFLCTVWYKGEMVWPWQEFSAAVVIAWKKNALARPLSGGNTLQIDVITIIGMAVFVAENVLFATTISMIIVVVCTPMHYSKYYSTWIIIDESASYTLCHAINVKRSLILIRILYFCSVLRGYMCILARFCWPWRM